MAGGSCQPVNRPSPTDTALDDGLGEDAIGFLLFRKLQFLH